MGSVDAFVRSHLAFRLQKTPSPSSTSKIARHLTTFSANDWASTKSTLSADVWYSANRAYGVRDKTPTAKLNPGEQYCRSSYPYGLKFSMLKDAPQCWSTCCAA